MSTRQDPPRANLWKEIVASIAGKPRDYTQGALGRAILLLAIPMVLEMSMQALFSVVDVYFVARLGTMSVAVVTLTEAMLMIVFAVAIGLSMGTTAMVARRVGEGNVPAASKVALQAILIGIGVAVVVALIGVAGPRFFLSLMGGSPALVEEGSLFFAIIFGGNVTIVLLFLINAIFRGAGDPALAMRALWLANIINMILAPILIFGWGPIPAFGLEGAAIATTVGRGLGVIYQLWVLTSGRSKIRIDPGNLGVDPAVMRRLVRISAFGILQFLISTASFLFLAKIMSKFGDAALAGHTLAVRLITFVLLPVWGVGNAAATLVGQNLGAGKPDRAERSVWVTGFVNMCMLGAVGVVFIIGAEWIVGLFPVEDEVQVIASSCLRIVAYSYVFWGYGMTTVMAFNGAGDTVTPTWINFLVFWVLQIPLAWTLGVHFERGPQGVFMAVAICQVVLAIVGVLVFRRGKWKTRTV
ncbi:MAG: MATE family efflux transporter [Acidobacteria bacterium]|nr:MATE family efflux transporter [Acidobacteriota bacterium]